MTTTHTGERQFLPHGVSAAQQHSAGAGGGASGARNGASGLAWVRFAMGVSEILAPAKVSGWTGSSRSPRMTRLMGLRQATAGVGMLTKPKGSWWLWARVGGDALAMAALVKHSDSSNRMRTGIALASLAGITAYDIASARRASDTSESETEERSIRFSTALTVNRPPHEVYQYWHHIENFPKIFRHLKSVRITGDTQSHWIARGPIGSRISWDAETTEDVPNERIAWRSLPGATIPNSGSVRFEGARGGRGTIIRVRMSYDPPMGSYPLAASFLGQYPVFQLRKDLLRFKQLLETGEVATTQGQPSGRGVGSTWLDRVARI